MNTIKIKLQTHTFTLMLTNLIELKLFESLVIFMCGPIHGVLGGEIQVCLKYF